MTELAAEFTETGQHAEALAALREAARFDPDGTDVRGAIARAALASGDLATVDNYLTRDVAGDDPELLTALVELDLKSWQVDSATEIVRVLAESPGQRQRVIELGHRLGFVGTYRTLCMAPEPGFRRILEGVRHLTVAA